MCSKGNPSTTTAQQQNTSQSGNTQGQQMQTGFSQLGPNPDTLALYNQFLQHIGGQGVMSQPFDTNMMQQTVPWTAGQDAASNYQIGLGMQGMPYGADAAALLNQGAQSTVGQIPGVASSLMSPWANQAVNYGQQQGQNISNYATNLAAQGPQLEQFSQAAIDRYMSPYINDVVNATQNQFTNANAQQGNVLLGQGIRAGNAFGGDRAGVAAAQLGNQQQLAQAPVIAGLYNTGYNTALGEFNTQNALAAQLGQMALQGQQAGAQLGMQGYGLGLNASTAANSLAAQALAQNQNAALQGGSMLGQLGGLTYSQNLAGGAQANQAAQIYPAYLQNLYATQAANAQMANAYPFQTSSWYGGLLQGIGGLTGTQQQNVNAALSNYLTNQQGTSLINGSTTPPTQNSWLQAAGLGIAGLGLLAKRGGSVPRMPHRAMGGGIPRYAAGGPAGGRPGMGGPDLNFLTGGFGDAIQPRALQATHLAAPNTAATDIKLPVLSTLTFPGMSSPSASTGTQGSQSTLGQAGALLGNKQVQSGLKGIGNFIFGNNDVSVASLGSGSDVVGTEPSGGPNPLFRRGGTVAMRHYPSGGYVGAFDDRYVDTSEEQPAEEESADTGLGNWVEGLMRGIPNIPRPFADDPEQVDDQPPTPEKEPSVPPPYADQFAAQPDDLAQEEVPMPRPKPAEANEFVPNPYADDLALPDDQPQPMTPEAQGQPERQAGIGPERGGGRGGRGRGRGRPERIDFPGQQRSPQGFLSRWASNPLTQFGLGLASAKGAGLTGVAEGLNMGLSRVQAQQIANDKLDKNYKLDTSGDTTRLVFPTHAIDTKLPTRTKLAQQQQRIGRIPAGFRMNDEGVLEKIPGGPESTAIPRTAASTQGRTGKPETLDQAATRRFLEAKPDATAEDIVAFKQTLKKGTSATGGAKIPSPAQKDLATTAATIGQLDDLMPSFKPDYAGFKSQWIGEAANQAALRDMLSEGRKEAAVWWQGYDRYKADIRHGKFGASLTQGEKEAWNALDVNPGMAPDAIMKNLERQQKIVDRAALNKAKSLVAQGISQEAIETQLGVSIEKLEQRMGKTSKSDEGASAKGTSAAETPAAAPTTPAAPVAAQAVPPPDKREVGKVYSTPKGDFEWTGSGWRKAK